MLAEYWFSFSRKNVIKRRLVSSFVWFGSTKAGVKESKERIDTCCSDWLLNPKYGSTVSKTAPSLIQSDRTILQSDGP